MMKRGPIQLATVSAGSIAAPKQAKTTAFLMGRKCPKRHNPINHNNYKWAGYSSSCSYVGVRPNPCSATRQTFPHLTSIIKGNHQYRPRIHQTRLVASYSNGKDELEDQTLSKVVFQSLEDSLCQTVLPRLFFNSDGIETQQSAVFVVAVSGGCDSMALLHALVQLLQQREPTSEGNNDNVESPFQLPCSGRTVPCELHVVHFDHEQRGLESDGDRLLVEKTCQEYGLPFYCHYWRTHDAALISSTGNNASPKFSQDLARTWRQHHLIQLLNELTKTPATQSLERTNVKAGVILTAHHADDHYETMLLKLLRGTHITHLSGMDMVTVHEGGCLFAKPLLKIPKCTLEEFLSSQGLAWRTDASNASNKYLRNRVRNELLPLMSDMAGGSDNLQRRLDTLEEQSQKVKEYLQASSAGQKEIGVQFPISATMMESFDIVLEEALHSWASTNGYYLPYDQLKRICQQLSDYPQQRQWTLHVGGGWNIVRTGDILELHASDEDENHRDVPILPRLSIMGRYQGSLLDTDDCPTIENGTELLIKVGSEEASNFSVQRVEDQAGAPFLFLPPWRKGRSPIKVKEFLRGQKVPLHLRDHAPMICLDHTHIVAVFVPSNSSSSNDEAMTNNSGKWIVHADFEPPSIFKDDLDVDKQDDIIIRLQLLTP
eukprot:CAMPEP_0198291730 /NCGR_PEP_ID=MMETSP1449-20131203/9163_1 /TAXON_ID=420275 /ORGANISM="Attheya septentrionalis, Strain CCMP2084" /LENGTH=658 /DNA_ID=CAMNT_0043990409 /DNA_START=377 /DNA_END=2353 /DNA_ORIENTATION=-